MRRGVLRISTAYHLNADGSTDYGVLQINGKAHAGYFSPQTIPEGWIWTDYLDNAEAAFEIYVSAKRTFTPWVAYAAADTRPNGTGAGPGWTGSCGGQMTVTLSALTKQGKTEAAALAQIAA